MLAILALMLALPTLAPAQTAEEQERDRGLLTRVIEDNLSTVSRQVVIEGFAGALSSRATVETLTIADEEGVWLRATGLVLDWNRAAVLRGRININTLGAEEIAILRPPVSDPPPPSPEATPFALPELPVSIDIRQLDAARIVLGAPLLGEEVVVALAGAVRLEDGEGSATLNAERIGAEGRFDIAASFSNATRVLSLDVDLDEAPGGIVARVLGLPGDPAVALTLEGTGPLDDYAATMALATDGVTRVTGDFGLVTVPGDADTLPRMEFRLDVGGDLTPLLPTDYAAFFGPDSRLSAQGARDEDGVLRLPRLALSTEKLSLSGAATIGADGWPEVLSLSGRLADAGGEPVLLPIPGPRSFVRAVDLDLSYDSAAGADWTLAFVARDVTRPGLRVDRLAVDGGGVIRRGALGTITADLAYAASGLALDDPGLAQALGPEISGNLQARGIAGRPAVIEGLSLRGPGLTIDAGATIGALSDGLPITASARVAAAELARFATLAGIDLAGAAGLDATAELRPLDGAIDLTLNGETQDLALGIAPLDPLLAGTGTLRLRAIRDEAGTRVEDLRIATPATTLTGDAVITSAQSRAELNLRIADIGLALPGTAGPGDLAIRADIAGDGTARAEATLSLPEGGVRIDGSRAADGTLSGMLAAELADLSPFAALAGRPLAGAITLDLAGVAAPDLGGFDASVTARGRDLGLGDARIDPLLAGQATLAGRIIRLGPRTFELRDLSLATPLVGAMGGADLDADMVRARDLALTVTDLAPFSALAGRTLAGSLAAQIDGSARIDGSLFDLTLAARGRDLSVDLPQIDPILAGDISLSGQAIRSGPQAFAVTDLSLTAPAVQASGTARLEGERLRADDLALSLPDLAPFSTLAGRALEGSLDARVTGSAALDAGLFDLDLSARGRDLRVAVPMIDGLLTGDSRLDATLARTGTDSLRIDSLTASTPVLSLVATGALTDGAGNGAIDLRLADTAPLVPGLTGPARLSGDVTRDASGTIGADLVATGPGGLSARGSGTARPVASGAQALDLALSADIATLAPWSGLSGRPLSGAVSATLGGTLHSDLDRFDLTLDARASSPDIGVPALAILLRGDGTAGARLRRDPGAGGLVVEGLSVAFPNLTLSGALNGAGGAGQASFAARLADIGLFAPDFAGPVTADGTARLESSGLWRIATDVTGPGGIGAVIGGTVAPDGRLGLDITGSAPLGLANPYIAPQRLDGSARLALTVTGPPALSSLGGTITLQDGRLAAPALGQAVEDLGGTIRLTAGQARLDIAGSLAAGGRLGIDGSIGTAAPYPADLSIGLDRLELRDPALYRSTADGAISLRGPLTGAARIAGRVTLGRTDLQVPASGIGALGAMPDVIHRAPSGPVRLTLERAGLTVNGAPVGNGADTADRPGYALDLTILAPARIFIRGRGLDAELGGELRIGGTTARPVPAGEFGLIRGRLDILQQRFTLTEGSIALAGDFVPVLRLVADTRTADGTQVSITVEGPATEPEVRFSSTPELPQDEVLARLLFGRDLSSISALQAVQLAAAVGTLAGRGGTGIIGSLRETIGLDDLDFTTDEDGGAAIRAGKYLSENVYTDVTLGNDRSTVTLNLDVTDTLTARGTVTSEGESSIGIFFERDY